MTWRVICGDARSALRDLPDQSVQCVVTSPPYFGLRDYEVEGQIGYRQTLEEYVASLVEAFRGVRRALRDDGVLWLNLGDSYTSSGRDRYDTDPKLPERMLADRPAVPDGLKAKDLVLVPARVALALQADGWYLRSEVIWHKPNPLPESVLDRPTASHEHLFLLTKSERYLYDAYAVREEDSGRAAGNGFAGRFDHRVSGGLAKGGTGAAWSPGGGRNRRSVWTIPTQPYPGAHFAVFPLALPETCVLAGSSPHACPACGAPWRRALDRVRTLDGEPLEGAWDTDEAGRIGASGKGHWRARTELRSLGFYPTCACGAPRGVRAGDLEPILTPLGERGGEDPSLRTGRAGFDRPRGESEGTRPITRYEQRRYAEQLRALDPGARSTAEHEAGGQAFAHYVRTDRSGARPVPPALLEDWIGRGLLERVEPPTWAPDDSGRCVVLDPFCGAGTTGMAALQNGRDFVGVELSPEYAELARCRIRDDAPLMNVAAEVT